MVQCRTKTTNSGLTTWRSWRNRCISIPDTPLSITLTSRYDADDPARAAAAEQLRQNRERRCPSGEYAFGHPFASFDGGIEESKRSVFPAWASSCQRKNVGSAGGAQVPVLVHGLNISARFTEGTITR